VIAGFFVEGKKWQEKGPFNLGSWSKPNAIISAIGVILFLTGAQLALGSCDFSKDKGERFVTVITGALAVWNVGIAFVVGMIAYALMKRGWLRI
jgi:hypothetical protein